MDTKTNGTTTDFNSYRVRDGVAYITLTDRQGEAKCEALFDAADLPLVLSLGRRLSSKRNEPHTYVVVTKPTIYLHRLLMNPSGDLVVDHINGNGLDNRRSNLRICTWSERNCKRQGIVAGESGFRGVHKCRSGKWAARVGGNAIRRNLGRFDSAEEAARAYDKAALELFGEFAVVNFPNAERVDDASDAIWRQYGWY